MRGRKVQDGSRWEVSRSGIRRDSRRTWRGTWGQVDTRVLAAPRADTWLARSPAQHPWVFAGCGRKALVSSWHYLASFGIQAFQPDILALGPRSPVYTSRGNSPQHPQSCLPTQSGPDSGVNERRKRATPPWAPREVVWGHCAGDSRNAFPFQAREHSSKQESRGDSRLERPLGRQDRAPVMAPGQDPRGQALCPGCIQQS